MAKLPETIDLPMWVGFRAGARAKASTGQIAVEHHGDRVTDRQRAALAATKRRAATMKPVLLDAIVKAYPSFRQWRKRPKTITKSQLKERVELYEVLLTTDHFQGVGYVAYGFSCAWDPSGIVVLTHGDRVVAAGDFDVLEYPHADPMRVTRAPKGPTPAQRRNAIAKAKVRAKKNRTSLPLQADDEVWITLPEWAGFHAGPRDKASNGVVGVGVGGDAMGAEETGAPQQLAYRLVTKKAKANQRIVLDAIAKALPEHGDAKALASLVTLTSIDIHWVHRDELAYVGYELACAWDREHGVGVMTHGDRVVEVGQADTAILGWIAKRDKKKKKKKNPWR
jgi:hypothetical protein